MRILSVNTRGRTLDHVAFLYEAVDSLLFLRKRKEYDRAIMGLLGLRGTERVLDLGCGTGTLTKMISEKLRVDAGGYCLGIDASGKMIRLARKRRQSATCRFEAAAAEDLPFSDRSFDAVVSSLFFHHLPLDLKEKALEEAFRVLRPRGKIVVADMHVPATWKGALISHAARWLFLQPAIGENIKGILPSLMEKAGFAPPQQVSVTFGYIATFTSYRPGAAPANSMEGAS